MKEKLSIGELFVQMEKAPAFKSMREVKSGRLILIPVTYMQEKWAKALKIRLAKDGFEKVDIV